MADGLSIGTMFQNSLNSIQTDGNNLQENSKNLSSYNDGTIDQAEMLKVKFAMGQYSAMMAKNPTIICYSWSWDYTV
ncbi:MAG: hypothetical protein IJS54_07850 [Desulfovibrio sp.]|nr:hypothetical protein [Desulfovibrio sp.]